MRNGGCLSAGDAGSPQAGDREGSSAPRLIRIMWIAAVAVFLLAVLTGCPSGNQTVRPVIENKNLYPKTYLICGVDTGRALAWDMTVPGTVFQSASDWRATLVAKRITTTDTCVLAESSLSVPDSATHHQQLDLPITANVGRDKSADDYCLVANVVAFAGGRDTCLSTVGPLTSAGQTMTTTIVEANPQLQPVPWIGDGGYGSAGSSYGDSIGWFGSYPLVVRALVKNTNVGVRGESLDWQMPWALLDTVRDSCDGVTGNHEDLLGSGCCRIAILPGCPADSQKVIVRLKNRAAPPCTFRLFCIGDSDRSMPDFGGNSSPPLYLHQQHSDGSYYEGDGLWSAKAYGQFGLRGRARARMAKNDLDKFDLRRLNLPRDSKGVVIQASWRSQADGGRFSDAEIAEILGKVMSIYRSGGMWVDTILSGACSTSTWLNLTLKEKRGLLWDSRLTSYAGRGYASIHVVLGGTDSAVSDTGGDVLGNLVQYGGFASDAMHLGSAGLDSSGCSDYLDSCGCLVFTNDTSFDATQPGNGPRRQIYGVDLAALVVAHEVGHAIGLNHESAEEDKGVMSCPIDQYYHSYDHYAVFLDPTSKEVQDHYQINLRMKVGGETVVEEKKPVPGVGY